MRRDGIGVKGRQNIYLLYSAASNVATLSGIIVCTQPRLVVKDETYCGHGNHANGIHAEFCGGRSSRPTKETLKPILLQIRSQPGAAPNKRAPTATKTRSQDLPSRQIPWQWQTSGSARHQDTNPCCSLCPIVRSALPLFSRHSLLRRSLVTSSLRHAESTRSWRQIAIHHLLPRPCTIITTLLLRGDPTKRRSRLPTSTLKWAVKDSHSRTT